MKFYNIDLHISIIADIKKIFSELNHEVHDISLSDHTWVFNRPKDSIPMLDYGKWKNLTPKQLSDDFYKNYKEDLNDYDAFIVTYPPSFSLLYKHFNKPIIICNPIRYEHPFSFRKDDWKYFNDFLRDGVDNKQIHLVANNLFDKKYMEEFIERDVTFIPSICDYYNKYYDPKEPYFIYYSKGKIEKITSGLIKHKDELFKSHRHEDLIRYNGIIHFPYQVSYMSIFEQYTSNIPLFVPEKDFLIDLYKNNTPGILREMSWFGYYGKESKSSITYKGNFDPNDYKNFESVYHWIQYSDFYDENWMPHIIKFNSIKDLENKIETSDLSLISKKMYDFNKLRKEKIYSLWDNLLKNIL